MTVIDTPDGIARYRMLVVFNRLRLEQRGIRFRVNTHVAARRELGLPPRTPRAKVLAAWVERMREAGCEPDQR
jgi:hypothetical protein